MGGTYGGARKPAPFMCLILKMLQVRPHSSAFSPPHAGRVAALQAPPPLPPPACRASMRDCFSAWRTLGAFSTTTQPPHSPLKTRLVRAPHPRGCPPQIQPDKEIIIELIKNEEYKYVRALGAFYMRLVGKVR